MIFDNNVKNYYSMSSRKFKLGQKLGVLDSKGRTASFPHTQITNRRKK